MAGDSPAVDSSERPAVVPRSVAIIMDGNGRWAKRRGLERVKGHEAGAESVRDITRACRAWGVKALTLYSFSTENWRRPAVEVAALMNLLKRYVTRERAEILDNGIRLRAIGQLDRLPRYVRLPLEELIAASAHNRDMDLVLALSYGSRAEIVDGVRAIARKVARRELDPEAIDEATVAAHLATAELPDPDLVIRTSGEMRLSNFLLWQVAYAEFYVTDVLWPDFRRDALRAAFEAYARRERRFGRTSEQLAGGAGS